ncbi:uncharacterized protein TRIVIDRAFT_61870 [Trichoderma virens Gv29-8]|uniref:RNase H type-1 domain-containing protein n=1 Tax=Hypocrea virens (strain Gv29-8 / FGSC 10586) TaxID=413071 RepID=G9MI39_HYPVG|nr:uncharacterized protein TRIVIDRAFT_61870 [Trichoderma virens Gv29-8]EHK25156.1 hypothetical protein TRIVIDRAFT_61870 [Trichoderma virens Gv29-8]UKZ49019.1 hypothetical protein TrVGV298_003257 [Trichoderma virens]
MAKFNVARELRFCANIVIPSKERALDTATNIFQCNAGRRHRVFFTDGSTITTPKSLKKARAIPSGAAVAYQPLTPKKDRHWNVKHFTLTSRGRDSAFTELAAIVHALTFAVMERALYLDNNKKTSNGKARWSKVTVFSDCTSVLQTISKLRESTTINARLLDDPIIRHLMAVSQYLCDNEVQLELRWVPGHSSVEGNCHANAAARYAAKHPYVGMHLE